LDRIKKRREVRWIEQGKTGTPPPLNPLNTTVKFDNVARTREQMQKLGSSIQRVRIDYRKPTVQVLALFGVVIPKEPK
jgi:hypothetical protein